MSESEKKISMAKLALCSLTLFLYIFNVKLLAATWMPTGRLVFLITVIIYGVSGVIFIKKEIKKYPLYFISLFFVLVYVMVHFLFTGGLYFGLISKMIVFCAFSLFMAAMVSHIFPSSKLFIQSMALACFFQSVMVYISFLSPDYRAWLSSVLIESSNIPLTYAKRVPGFSNSSGSALSVLLSLGVFALMSLYYCTSKFVQKIIFLLGALFILSSCIFVGKLGLFLSIYFIFAIFFLEFVRRPVFVFKILTITFIALFILIKFTSLADFAHVTYAIERSFSLFMENEDSTLTALKAMPIPVLDINTLVGYGMIINSKGVSATGSDIGYIQNYYALGFIVSLIFYISLFMYLLARIIAVKHGPYRFLSLVLFIPLFIIELKEPFITKLGYSFVIFSFIFIVSKSSRYSLSTASAYTARHN